MYTGYSHAFIKHCCAYDFNFLVRSTSQSQFSLTQIEIIQSGLMMCSQSTISPAPVSKKQFTERIRNDFSPNSIGTSSFRLLNKATSSVSSKAQTSAYGSWDVLFLCLVFLTLGSFRISPSVFLMGIGFGACLQLLFAWAEIDVRLVSCYTEFYHRQFFEAVSALRHLVVCLLRC